MGCRDPTGLPSTLPTVDFYPMSLNVKNPETTRLIRELAEAQNAALAGTLAEVQDVLSRDRRRPAAPKAEKDLWGRP